MKERQIILETTKSLCEKLGLAVMVSWVEREGQNIPTVAVTTAEQTGMLIGKQGAHLVHFEHVVRVLAGKAVADGGTQLPLFSVDINGYRNAQIQRVSHDARMVAKRVVASHRAESLPAMSSYERKIIHMTLAEFPGVETESVGVDPDRRVMIKPSSEL